MRRIGSKNLTRLTIEHTEVRSAEFGKVGKKSAVISSKNSD